MYILNVLVKRYILTKVLIPKPLIILSSRFWPNDSVSGLALFTRHIVTVPGVWGVTTWYQSEPRFMVPEDKLGMYTHH